MHWRLLVFHKQPCPDLGFSGELLRGNLMVVHDRSVSLSVIICTELYCKLLQCINNNMRACDLVVSVFDSRLQACDFVSDECSATCTLASQGGYSINGTNWCSSSS